MPEQANSDSRDEGVKVNEGEMLEEKQAINSGAIGDTSQPITKKRKDKNKRGMGWKIATGVLGVATLGLAGFLTYYLIVTDHSEKQCEEITCEVAEVTDEETGEKIKVVKVPVGNSDDDVAVREIAGKLYDIAANLIYDGPGWNSNLVHAYDETIVLYQPEGLKTSTVLNLSYGFKLVFDGENSGYNGREDLIINDDLYNALVKELTQNGYKKYDYGTMMGEEYINEQAGIVCSIGYPGLAYVVGCSSVNWYNADDWDFINALAEAYKKKEGEYPFYMGASTDNIQDSGYEKYQRLTVSFLGAAGEFYRVSPDSEWIFFRGGQDAPACSEYDTDDLKRAFVGATCWDEATGGTKKVEL